MNVNIGQIQRVGCLAMLAACACCVVVVPNAHAGETESWPFSITTEGEDVSWSSPTTVRANAQQFDATVTINELLVEGLADIGFGDPVPVGPIDVIDEIPEEDQTQSGSIAGPAPVTVVDQSIVFPEPPEEPTFSGDVLVEIDAQGTAHLSMTNIELGTATLDVPPFGTVDVQLTSVTVSGDVEVDPVGVYGDLTGDDQVNVKDLLGLLAGWGDCPAKPEPCPADLNNDGVVNVNDLLDLLAAWG